MSGSGAKNLRSLISTEPVSPISVDWDGCRRSPSPNHLIVLLLYSYLGLMKWISCLFFYFPTGFWRASVLANPEN